MKNGKKPDKNLTTGVLVGVVVLVTFIVLGFTSDDKNGNKNLTEEQKFELLAKQKLAQEHKEQQQAIEAYNFSKDLIANNYLTSPSTAKFASVLDGIKVLPLGENRYYAESYVDSQNGFGANVRTRFEVWINYVPSKTISIEQFKPLQ